MADMTLEEALAILRYEKKINSGSREMFLIKYSGLLSAHWN